MFIYIYIYYIYYIERDRDRDRETDRQTHTHYGTGKITQLLYATLSLMRYESPGIYYVYFT